jgi:hypothetical protein
MAERKIIHVWYVDDILLLGRSKAEVEHNAAAVVQQFTRMGIQVNAQKSSTQASQQVTYLGQILDLANNKIAPQPQKVQAARKLVTDILSGIKVLPRILAKAAGLLLDLEKGVANLHGLPRQLMKAAGLATTANRARNPGVGVYRIWNTRTKLTVNARQVLQEVRLALDAPVPKVLHPNPEGEKYVIQTDASDNGWGGRLMKAGVEVHAVARPWTIQEARLHITAREALGSAFSVREFLDKLPVGCVVEVQSDSTPTVWTWRKGSRLKAMNSHIAKVFVQIQARGIYLTAQHIPGKKNTRADWLSRNPDHQSFRLSPQIFRQVCQKFRCTPTVDLFANRFNRQVEKFCAWRLDNKSLGNAWQISWGKLGICFLNPPWALLHTALNKLRQDKATALACIPVWRSAPWWSAMMEMAVTPLWIWKDTPMFQDPRGVWMPPPRWATAFVLLQGSGKLCDSWRRDTTFRPNCVSASWPPSGKKPHKNSKVKFYAP